MDPSPIAPSQWIPAPLYEDPSPMLGRVLLLATQPGEWNHWDAFTSKWSRWVNETNNIDGRLAQFQTKLVESLASRWLPKGYPAPQIKGREYALVPQKWLDSPDQQTTRSLASAELQLLPDQALGRAVPEEAVPRIDRSIRSRPAFLSQRGGGGGSPTQWLHSRDPDA